MEHLIIVSMEDFFSKAFDVIIREFQDQKGKDNGRLLTMFKILSTAMENLTIVWGKAAKKREDGLYEFTLDEFKAANKEVVDKISEVALKGTDAEFGMLYSLIALTASAIIDRVGKTVAGEPDDSEH